MEGCAGIAGAEAEVEETEFLGRPAMVKIRPPKGYRLPELDAHIRSTRTAGKVCREIGRTVARLHAAGITHGDLTTSNMILLPDGGICLLDMSMGKTRSELEDIGVDLRLLERAFSSAHVGLEEAFSELMDEYYVNTSNPDAVRKRVEDIRNRGRYT